MRLSTIWCLVLLLIPGVLCGQVSGARGDEPESITIYVDLSGVDSIPGLSESERRMLKEFIKLDMAANFADVGLGSYVHITSDPSSESDRQVRVRGWRGYFDDQYGRRREAMGLWPYGATYSDVYVRSITDPNPNVFKKPDGKWDLSKLSRAIGMVICHEVAHSYSVGHGDGEIINDKMVDRPPDWDTFANREWWFTPAEGKVLARNFGKKPCKTAALCPGPFLLPIYDETPNFPEDPPPCEPWNFNAFFSFTGAFAPYFDLGWYGEDSDGGMYDGNSEFDFIYKTSMEGVPGEDANLLTFFPDAHSRVHFVLCGQEGTPYAGIWFPMSQAVITPSDFVVTPFGHEIFRYVHIGWDLEGGPGYEVEIMLNSLGVYGEYGTQYNGWQLVPEPTMVSVAGLAGLAGLAIVRRRLK